MATPLKLYWTRLLLPQKRSKALTHLIHAEKNKCCYAAFHNHTKPWLSGGLMYITVNNDPQQPPTTILDHDELGNTLLAYSWNHFAKAHGSPFTMSPLDCLLQYDGLNPLSDLIFKGHNVLDPLPLDKPTCALLTHLCNKTSIDSQSHPLHYGTMMNGIKKWPEKSATSQSGCHLGIYKSLQCHV